MSRIHDVLNKAEREGATQHTRAAIAQPEQPVGTRGTPEAGPSARLETMTPAYVEPTVSVRVDVPALDDAPPPPAAPLERPMEAPIVAPPPLRSTGTEPSLARAAGLDPVLVAALAPHSLAAEQYRALRTRILQSENGAPLRIVLLTSPGKGEGKSVSAANLALTMAQQVPSRVLLLDADLRRPRSHRLLGLDDRQPGLADVLMGGEDLESALVPVPGRNLWVLPAGLPPGHPAELLGSSGMRRVLDTLRTRFDRVVVDTPPIAPLADVRILSPMADGIVLVVRAGVTPRPAIERALAGFDRKRVLGIVLNDAEPTDPDPYGYARNGRLSTSG
jgi:capsular exopolysaccharide synthesis family protein